MRKFLKLILLILFLAACGFGYWAYKSIWMPNVPENLENHHFYITAQDSFDKVVHNLYAEGFIKDSLSFYWVSKLMKYDNDAIKPGKYLIETAWSNRQLIRILRAGEQETVQLTFNQVRTAEELAGVIASYIEADSMELIHQINDIASLGDSNFNLENRLCLFIPNTYEFYWSTDAREFLDRMKKEHQKFWNQKERKEKLGKLGLTANEAYILASIVEKETNVQDEKSTVAGVYLNRLNKGIRLQADPTVVYASGNFGLRRVLNRHLEIESPYNTYLNDGLPPGPICMPDISTIDAVLNAEDHEYLYFCAKPGYSGRHAFAKTLAGHNRNAAEYRRWLNREKIK